MRDVWDRISAYFGRLPLATRIAWGLAAVAIIAVVSGVGVWSSQPEYIPLASGLSPAEAADLVSKLDTAGLANQMNFSGSTVLVPKHLWNQARIAAGDLAGQSAGGPDWTDSVMGDPALNRFKMLRHREQALANSIAKMNGVANATVHIAQPDPSPFISEQEPTTASVILELKPGMSMTREQAAAIVALVSRSVEGLAADSISVMDSRGRVLSSPSGELQADVSGQFEYRRLLEADLAAKANLMLSQMLGDGRAIVRVTAEVDFTRTQRTETVFDPNQKVRKKEKVMTSLRESGRGGGGSSTGGGSGGDDSGGPAGSGSNVGDQASAVRLASGSGPFKETKEENETDYDTASTVDTVMEAPGKIKRLTIAVMADLGTLAGENSGEASGAANPTKQPTARREDIEAIVKQAVGFDEARNDQIQVLVTPLAGQQQENLEYLTLQKWDFYRQLARSSSLGLASVVALVLGMLTLRRMRPILVPATSAAPEEDRERRRSQTISELSQRMRENPDMAKAILSAWARDSRDAESGGVRRSRAA